MRKGPISARFPAFAEQGRRAVAAAVQEPKEAALQDPQSSTAAASSGSAESELKDSHQWASLVSNEGADGRVTAVADRVVREKAISDGIEVAPEEGAESDASSSSNDAKLQSPPKRAKQLPTHRWAPSPAACSLKGWPCLVLRRSETFLHSHVSREQQDCKSTCFSMEQVIKLMRGQQVVSAAQSKRQLAASLLKAFLPVDAGRISMMAPRFKS